MVGKTSRLRRAVALVATAVAAFAAMAAMAVSAQAETAAPGWASETVSYPTRLAPGTEGYLLVQVFNVGGKASHGKFTVTDVLPEGMVATEAGYGYGGFLKREKWECSVGSVVTCTNNDENLAEVESLERVPLLIAVRAPAAPAGPGTNEVTVSGGGASSPAHSVDTIEYGAGEPGFGYSRADMWLSAKNGGTEMQAGAHPYALFTSLGWNNSGPAPIGEARDVTVNLPRGFVGNPTAVAQCTEAQLNAEECPAASQVGVDYPTLGGVYLLNKPEGERPPIDKSLVVTLTVAAPVYNMVPEPGHPATLGFTITGTGAHISTGVRSGGDYGLNADIRNIPQVGLTFNTLAIWGAPFDYSHDWQRTAKEGGEEGEGGYTTSGHLPHMPNVPFLTMPTSCEGSLEFKTNTESWPEAGIAAPVSEVKIFNHTNTGASTSVVGCDRLRFEPEISVSPETREADTPAGLTVEVKTRQGGLVNPEGIAASDIKDTTVTLPEGVVVNPAQAQGLQFCSQAQSALGTEGEPSCPNASKVGTDEIKTPLLAHSLKGGVYVLESNPPNLKLLVQASGEGVNLKLVGDVHLNEATGRLETTFKETPQLPFSTFTLSFSGGARAALTTPTRCGTYTTTSDFTPWATPNVLDATPTSAFAVGSGPGGSGCPTGTLAFEPTLTAGSTTDQAGGFTSFSMMLKRGSDQQRIERLQFKAPPGLSGMLSKVPPCGAAQAEAGTCPAASQIGHSIVSSGSGAYPLVIPQAGQPESPIYLTGPYDGAPFGLSIVTHVIAGPFNLGTIVTRGKIEIDPRTAQITVTTDPLPQIIKGVPTNLRMVDAVIDRKGFMINPTSCEPMSFSGTAWGAVPAGAGGESSTAPIASRFQVGSCRGMPFKPKLTALTHAAHSRKTGAYLHVVMKSSHGQANIHEVRVELPREMPAELTTLKHSCTEAQFDKDPSGCPKESRVGHATIYTPVLPVPLKGPAIFVSHGNAKYPELVMVLKGDGVTIVLNGETKISKGITTSTFRTVPDQPFSRFDLVLPRRSFPALAGTTNFCRHKLVMPTRIVAQSGKVVERKTRVQVSGCKAEVWVVKHQTHGSNVTILVHVPSKGKLVASGNGIDRATKTIEKKGGRVAITVHLTRQLRRELSRRHGHVKEKVRLAFSSKHHKTLHATAKVRLP